MSFAAMLRLKSQPACMRVTCKVPEGLFKLLATTVQDKEGGAFKYRTTSEKFDDLSLHTTKSEKISKGVRKEITTDLFVESFDSVDFDFIRTHVVSSGSHTSNQAIYTRPDGSKRTPEYHLTAEAKSKIALCHLNRMDEKAFDAFSMRQLANPRCCKEVTTILIQSNDWIAKKAALVAFCELYKEIDQANPDACKQCGGNLPFHLFENEDREDMTALLMPAVMLLTRCHVDETPSNKEVFQIALVKLNPCVTASEFQDFGGPWNVKVKDLSQGAETLAKAMEQDAKIRVWLADVGRAVKEVDSKQFRFLLTKFFLDVAENRFGFILSLRNAIWAGAIVPTPAVLVDLEADFRSVDLLGEDEGLRFCVPEFEEAVQADLDDTPFEVLMISLAPITAVHDDVLSAGAKRTADGSSRTDSAGPSRTDSA